MTRRTIPLEEKIEKAQNEVFRTKEKYDAAVEELNSLLKKKKDADHQELVKLFDESPKTLEEVKAFLAEKTGQEDE